jgi:L-asparaginase II
MTNPVLVEVTRGHKVESAHRGAICIMDGHGDIVAALGNTEQPVFPRSAVKAIQALPLVESGAADAYGFGQAEIALACASHSGEPTHTSTASAMLAKAGLGEDALECGWHWPMRMEAALDLAATGTKPTQLHNNCSGKHAGFVCTCRHLGIDHEGYVAAGHRSQEMVREAMEALTGAPHGMDVCGTDGCAIPTYAVPIRSLALGFSRMAGGQGLSPSRARAARRILEANMAVPFNVAGTDRLDTRLMEAGQGRIMAKTGAEGVYCCAVPESGIAIALKCDDGATRAAEQMLVGALQWVFRDDDGMLERLAPLAGEKVLTRRGVEAGVVRFIGSFGHA